MSIGLDEVRMTDKSATMQVHIGLCKPVTAMTKIYAGVALAAIAALLGGTYLASRLMAPSDALAECRTGTVGGGTIGGPLELVNGDGQTVTEAQIFTKPSLLYFGYTFCPDVCPMDSARNAEAVDILEERGMDVTPVFITVDPKRDTQEVVKDFAKNLHPKMIGLTGSEDQVKAASLAYKTYFKIQESPDEFYLVDHSTFTYLVLPKIGFVEFFKRDISSAEMADKVACFIENTPS
jgi:protein SCO1